MNVKHMEYFIVLSEEMNFSYAAERLGVSQPTLTQMVQKLEKELNTPLFEKKNKRITLTAAGRVFFKACRKITTEYAETLSALEDLRCGVTGKIRFGIAPSRAPYILPPLLERFNAEFPGVFVGLEELLTAETEERLLSDDLDLGLTSGSGKMEMLEYTPVFRERILIAATDELLERLGIPVGKSGDSAVRPIAAQALSNLPFVTLGSEQVISTMFSDYCADEGVPIRKVSACKTIETGLALANSGTCAALVTSSAMRYYSRVFPDLRYYSFGDDRLCREVYLVCRKGKSLTVPEQRIIEILKEMEKKHD
ncbi:MAG: LysR family transcriptional regulator [Clostridia bacterium]|nr:LysR family transcriptional regulator [Clostridia bacterium]